MKSESGYFKKNAAIAGLLFFCGLIAGLLSIAPPVESADYLVEVSKNEMQVLSGAFFQFLMIPAYIGSAIALYPVLKMYSEPLALGFAGSRIMAGVFHMIGVIILPLFIVLSREFLKAGSPDNSNFQTLGELMRAGRDLTNHVAMILPLGMGSLLYSFILLRARLVPVWLCVWGFVAALLTVAASLCFLFALFPVISVQYMIMNIPMGLQELVLALWLIVRGFSKTAIDSLAENKSWKNCSCCIVQ